MTEALEDIANSDDGDFTAVGLAGTLRRYKFVSCVLWQKYYQSLHGLKFFTENLSFTSIKPAVIHAKSTLHGIDITSMKKLLIGSMNLIPTWKAVH